VFDKTGTITGGIPEITDIISVAENDDELLGIAYSLEKNSTHPLAGAVITRARQGGLALFDNSSFENIAGSGIRAVINGETYIIGSLKWIFSLSIDTSIFAKEIENFEAQGKTVMALAKENRLIGILAASDTVRQSAAPAVEALKQKGISVAMLTGDNIRAAGFMAEQADIDDVIAGLLPDEKLYEIKKMQQKGITVMVGDGINDAPALAAADIGLALSTGTDIAMEAGDVVLMKSDLMLAVKAYNLSRATLAKIKQNLFWAFFYNIIGIPLAAFGLLNPMIAGTAMALSSVSVLTNSLLLKNKKI
jgi:Cu+-exporting ATPase